MTLALMSRDRKPRLSFQIEPEDQAALDALLSLVPGVQGTGVSLVLRAIFRLGMPELAKDVNRVLTAGPPRVEDIMTLGKQAHPGPRVPAGQTSAMAAAGFDTVGSAKSLTAARERLAELEKEEAARNAKLPPVKPTKRPPGAPRDRGSSGRTGSRGSEG
jgi:hypothetical protein